MAHQEQLQFVQIAATHLANEFSQKRILEIGSYNVNGSIREYFEGSTYVGVDIMAGPGVDIVCSGDRVADPDGTYHLTVSCECFEHNPHWRATFLNMYRMTKSGGIVLFTCATTGRLEHGTRRTLPNSSPGNQDLGWDYYRNLAERDFQSSIALNELFNDYVFISNPSSQDLYFIGRKVGDETSFRLDTRRLVADYWIAAKKLQTELDAQSPYPQLLRWISKALFSPLKLAERLVSDEQYQNFALAYIKTMNLIRRPVQRSYEKLRGMSQPRETK